MNSYQIGVDLGGTKTEVIVLDSQHRELHRKRIATPRGTDREYESICHAVYHLIRDAAALIPESGTYTVGIGIPGVIAPETGLVINANTTSLMGRPFRLDMENLLETKVEMENDANCFTLAESRRGAGKNYKTVFGIIMGTGCGGGLCMDGQIHRGRHGIAGEWGHFSVDPRGNRCYCGNRGCVETKISGSGVEDAFWEKFDERLPMRDIVDGFRKGEYRCAEVFRQFLDDFGRCLGGLISVLDPDAVVLGGGLSNIEELYTLGVERVKRYAFHPQIHTPILRNELGDSAGVYGAAWIGKK
ncbi:MAG: ROK family protein [Desulfobacterales bacterium]